MSTVVVVDDDRDSVRTLSTLLEMKGITVEGKGYDGKDAVELYENLRLDEILMEMMMPQYYRIYAIKTIKELDPDARILVLTA